MIRYNISLQRLNTFGLPSIAEQFLPLRQVNQLAAMYFERAPALVLGGGSNLLLREYVPGLTVQVLLGGVEELGAAASAVSGAKNTDRHFRVGGGVDWNQFVRFSLDQGLSGAENLVLIPGTVGAAPVQNIGAYGAEVADLITAVHVYEYGYGPRTLSAADCDFGYRDSRFKKEPGRFLITAVDLRLTQGGATVNTSYGAISSELERLGIEEPRPADVALAVTNIRRRKLPDWFFLGNSGSFFKNPVVPIATLHEIRQRYPDVPSYSIDEQQVKLPAGWLIDQCGLKGERRGAVGTYAHQALVVVNHGGATGREVLAYSEFVQAQVLRCFGVMLEREVRLVGAEE